MFSAFLHWDWNSLTFISPPHPSGLYACKEGRNSPCLVYVTFNQKIYVYWEVQLERMESTNLLKLLESEPEFQNLLQELGVGESGRASAPAALRQVPSRATASEPPLSCPQILTISQPSAACFTKPSTIQTSPHAVLLRASMIPPSRTCPPS